MRDTMRDGQKATRTTSNRSKVPKEPLGRVDTTTSRPEITRAPSSMDATRAAGAAINRHGTPMHPAITKPRESPAKPQPVRRPRRGTNTPPSPIFEDIDLELDLQSGTMSSRSTNPSSFGSSARKKESFDSWSTGPDQHSLRASDDGSRFRTETPGTEGQGPLPRATKERGCFMNALRNFWEDWKEVRRLGGPSMEAMLWEDIKDWWSGGNKKMTDVERPAAAQPAYELDQFASEANRGFLEQAQRAVTPRVPPAAARRGGPGRPHDSDVDTEVTTWSKVINQSRGIGSKSGLRNEVRNDSPHKGDDPSRGSAFRIRTQHQGLDEHRDDTIDHNSFDDFDGDHGDDWDRQTRAPTMASSNHGARMSHANPSDWQPVNAPRPTSSIYTTTTNGHPNSQHYGRSETPPSVPAIPGEYLHAQAPRNPRRDMREPVSPMNETYNSSNIDEYTSISPLQPSSDQYVSPKAQWQSKRNRNGRRDTWERQDDENEERGDPNTDAHLLALPKAAGGGSQGYTKSLAETHTTEMTSVTKLLGKPDKDGKWDKIIK